MKLFCKHKYEVRCAEFYVSLDTTIPPEAIGGFVEVFSKYSGCTPSYYSYCNCCKFTTYTELYYKSNKTDVYLKVYIKECNKYKKKIKCDAFDAQEFSKNEEILEEAMKEL